MKLEITDNQCTIIMNALEKYYYLNKSEHQDKHFLDEINKLEICLMRQAFK